MKLQKTIMVVLAFGLFGCGGYMSTKLIQALPDDSRVSLIRLDRYETKCYGRGAFPVKLWCPVDMELTVGVDGKQHRIAVKGEKLAGGRYLPGDISPPFSWGNRVSRVILHQAQIVADYAVKEVTGKISGLLKK